MMEKKLIKYFLSTGAVLLMLIGLGVFGNAAKADVPIYRMLNPNSGEHFYTTSTYEVNSLVTSGWQYEGESWTAPNSGSAVYRLYNPNSGVHFYTTSSYKDSEAYLSN
ncbi:MAG: hypothetical protein LBV19_07365 [Streptococcaceae bacterium]|nr:hypothetical protein [Streptococcaceae bacterium]